MSNFYKADGAAMTSNKQDWETPQAFFDKLNERFKFDLDACATHENAKIKRYYTEDDDALEQDWRGNVFCNPPYDRKLKLFIKKAYEESLKNKDGVIVLLIPSRTDTSYWHDYIFGKAEIEFLRGRLKFEVDGNAIGGSPFPSALIIYGGENVSHAKFS